MSKEKPHHIGLSFEFPEMESLRCFALSDSKKILYCSGDIHKDSDRKRCSIIVFSIQNSKIISNFISTLFF